MEINSNISALLHDSLLPRFSRQFYYLVGRLFTNQKPKKKPATTTIVLLLLCST